MQTLTMRETLEDIEIAVREQVLENVSPEIALFLLKEKPRREREENVKSKVVLDS
jgi:hypothetical protein